MLQAVYRKTRCVKHSPELKTDAWRLRKRVHIHKLTPYPFPPIPLDPNMVHVNREVFGAVKKWNQSTIPFNAIIIARPCRHCFTFVNKKRSSSPYVDVAFHVVIYVGMYITDICVHLWYVYTIVVRHNAFDHKKVGVVTYYLQTFLSCNRCHCRNIYIHLYTYSKYNLKSRFIYTIIFFHDV